VGFKELLCAIAVKPLSERSGGPIEVRVHSEKNKAADGSAAFVTLVVD